MLEIHGISVLVTHRTVSEFGSSLDKQCAKYLWDGLEYLPRPGHFSPLLCHCVLTVRVGDPGGSTAHGCPDLSKKADVCPQTPEHLKQGGHSLACLQWRWTRRAGECSHSWLALWLRSLRAALELQCSAWAELALG